MNVRYLYQPGEFEGGQIRATDPNWSLKVFRIEKTFIKPIAPVTYYLRDGPKQSFIREELLSGDTRSIGAVWIQSEKTHPLS